MTVAPTTTDPQALLTAIEVLRQRLTVMLEATASESSAAIPDLPTPPPSLAHLTQLFRLSPFESHLLLLCAGLELDFRFADLCKLFHGDSQRPYVTFGLALTVLPDPHWCALTPQGPLRRWRLLEVGGGHALTTSPLRIDERILHMLTGTAELDERLQGVITRIHADVPLMSSQEPLVAALVAAWASPVGDRPLIQLCGPEIPSKRAIAQAACDQLGYHLYRLATVALPTPQPDLTQLLRLWERETLLTPSALLLEWDEQDTPEPLRAAAIARLLQDIRSPLMIASRERRPPPPRPIITLDVQAPTTEEQRHLWHAGLNQPQPLAPPTTIERLVGTFHLSATAIQAVCAETQGQIATQTQSAPDPFPTLWEGCRVQARPQLDDLAERLDARAGWETLVLPDAQREILRAIAAQVRQRGTVYEQWGFGRQGQRGLGITALFAGPSGTGKTLAAEVLARELALDLYRIDLSQVVSKYIGETEKNLRRVFDAAESGGVILLFDEADALFGKRSEVRDSHDRYANMEVSYLLQRMEAYRGLAILTTNLKDAIDQAFLRRLRFVVKFPFPDAAQRAEIWRRMFPPATPTQDLNVQRLAQLNITGGNIRSIALNAAFLAADAGEPVQMTHLLTATQTEYAKLERTLTGTELKGWG